MKQLINKIDGFGQYINAQRKMVRTKDNTKIILDNGFMVIAFTLDNTHFQSVMYNKLERCVLFRTKSYMWDNESITYDYESIMEIMELYQVI